MRGSRIQAIVRELNNEKIDIVNFSDQAEILVSRALSPAKPAKLFLDDEKKYCVALFDDDSIDAAIGRNGMNINLASQITEYKIDAYGLKQYERIQEDQKTPLSKIDGADEVIVEILQKIDINIVSDLLDADMGDLLKTKGVNEKNLDNIYEAVQLFIEREIEDIEDEVEDVLEELDIDISKILVHGTNDKLSEEE